MIQYSCLRVVLASAIVQLREMSASLFNLFIMLVQPFFIAVLAIYMLRHRPDFDATYVVVGTGLSGLLSVTLLTSSGTITRERAQGNLELLVASPTPLIMVFSGKTLATLAFSLTTMALSYAVGAWVFRQPVAIHAPAAFSLSLLLALVSLWAMGMLFAPLSIVWPPAHGFLQGLEYPVFILCGFLFPLLLLPGWVLPLSYALPPYWAARALHGTSSESLPMGETVIAWAILLATSALALWLAAVLLGVFLKRARQKGVLGFV